MKFDELCKYLVDNGFRRVSLDGPNKRTFMNKDYTISVIVEELNEEMTKEDVDRIKKRLKELGYL